VLVGAMVLLIGPLTRSRDLPVRRETLTLV
jgi:hypothetical protein